MLLAFIRRIRDHRFFSRKDELTSALQRIGWWEIRRIPYNLIVGLTGIFAVVLIFISGAVAERITGTPMGLPDPPIFALVGVVIYGILANACYTGGWITELFVVKVWEESGKSFGEISFTLGFIFSVLLTLSIGLFFSALNVIQIIFHLAGYPTSE